MIKRFINILPAGLLTWKAGAVLVLAGSMSFTLYTCHRQIVLDELQKAVADKETELSNKAETERQRLMQEFLIQIQEKDALIADLANSRKKVDVQIIERQAEARNEIMEIDKRDVDTNISNSLDTAIWTIQSSYGRRVAGNNQSPDNR